MGPMTFTFTLLLAVAMTTVNVKGRGMTDFLNLPAHKDHRYFYDVISEASLVDLKASLVNFTLDHSYKVLGESRYLFIFRSNDTEALQSLTFPSRSQVTQYPVETGEQYFEALGQTPNVTGIWDYPEHGDDNRVIFFADWSLRHSEDLCPQTWEMEIVSWGKRVKDEASTIRTEWFPIIATYPPRVFSFWALEDNADQTFAIEGIQSFGSYASSHVTEQRVINI